VVETEDVVDVEALRAAIELSVAVPNPAPVAPPGLAATANTMLAWLKWIGLVAGVLGFGLCALMMIVGRRNRSNMAVDGASGIPWVFAGLSLMTLSAGLVGAMLR
jgi:hypothetical protein